MSRARRAVRAFLQLGGVDAQHCSDLEVALGEAIGNAVTHGYGRHGSFSIHCTVSQRQVVLEVRDHGPGYDVAALPVAQNPEFGMRGFGLSMIRKLVDDVSFSDNGRRIRMVLKVSQPRSHSCGARRLAEFCRWVPYRDRCYQAPGAWGTPRSGSPVFR